MAIIVCKIMGLPDPRSSGSGNPGATNVLRIAGKLPAALTLAGDSLKGLLPVLVTSVAANQYFAERAHESSMLLQAWLCGCSALGSVIGHLFPLYFRFQGGKGVATALGALHALSPLLGLTLDAIWLVTLAITRISSVASLVAWTTVPFISLLTLPLHTVILFCISGLIIWRHKANITRLLNGTEPKIGGQKQP